MGRSRYIFIGHYCDARNVVHGVFVPNMGNLDQGKRRSRQKAEPLAFNSPFHIANGDCYDYLPRAAQNL